MSQYFQSRGKKYHLNTDGYEPVLTLPDGRRVPLLRELTDDEKAWVAQRRGGAKLTKVDVLMMYPGKPVDAD